MEKSMNDIKIIIEKCDKKYVGLKQFLRAVKEGEDIFAVFLASNVDAELKAKVEAKCFENKLKLYFVEKKEELGKLANIQVDASVITFLQGLNG